MNSLLELGLINEMPCGNNFAYVMKDNNLFSSTEYKVLQSKKESVFVKNMKILYNGQYQFYYMIAGYKTFSTMISSLDADSFMTIVTNIFADIIDVKNHGFLSCQNLDIAFDKIFIDPNTYKVKLIYLPSCRRLFSDESAFENELRTSMVKVITSFDNLASPKTTQFMADLTNGMYSVIDIYNRIKGGNPVSHGVGNGQKSPNGKYFGEGGNRVRIIAMGVSDGVELIVNKDRYVIGKKAESVDGVVSFNKMISRVHCKIERNVNGQYTITDLQSANGTYVNRVRLQANVPTPIKNRDVIRLANSDFQVVME